MATTPPDEPPREPTPPPPPPAAPPPQPPPTPPVSGETGYSARPTSTTNGLAIASLACSIGGFVVCGIGYILGIVFGFMAKNQIDQSGGTQQGRGLAVAGIIIGFVGLGIGLLVLLIVLIVSAASS